MALVSRITQRHCFVHGVGGNVTMTT